VRNVFLEFKKSYSIYFIHKYLPFKLPLFLTFEIGRSHHIKADGTIIDKILNE